MLRAFAGLLLCIAAANAAPPSGEARDYLFGTRTRFSATGEAMQSFSMLLNRTVVPSTGFYVENTTLVGPDLVVSFAVSGMVTPDGRFHLVGEDGSSFEWNGRFYEGEPWDWQSLVGSATDSNEQYGKVLYGTAGSWRPHGGDPATGTAYGSHQVYDPTTGKLLYIDVASGHPITEREYSTIMLGFGPPAKAQKEHQHLRFHL